jgi:hypothetical protein
LLVEQGKKKEAARLLEELYNEFIQSGAFLMVRTVRIYQALAADDEEQALDFLAEALTGAEPEVLSAFFLTKLDCLSRFLKKLWFRKSRPTLPESYLTSLIKKNGRDKS